LQTNGHYRLAYDNIGKILLRNGDYEEALDYLEYAKDSYYYSKAWALYRKDLIEQYLIYFVLALVAFVVILYIVKVIRKEREALEDYEDRKDQIRNRSASE
jgi:tetratricopeptide (TPR) repeat protein